MNVSWLEANSPVLDLDPNPVAALHQLDPDLRALAVQARIDKCFLDNSVDRIFQQRASNGRTSTLLRYSIFGPFLLRSSFIR